MTPNLVFFIGSQTFALTNYGNRTVVCQIRLAVGGQCAAGADYAGFSENPNTFSFFCSELRMQCHRLQARLGATPHIAGAATRPLATQGRSNPGNAWCLGTKNAYSPARLNNYLTRKREQ
jgi:hypothetical protein